MAGIIKCPKCGNNLLVSKMIEKSGEHKGMHKAVCESCAYIDICDKILPGFNKPNKCGGPFAKS